MKCVVCNQDIIVHSSLLNHIRQTNDFKLTFEDLITKGMIYTLNGLKNYSMKHMCEVCYDEQVMHYDRRKIRSYRLRIIKDQNN